MDTLLQDFLLLCRCEKVYFFFGLGQLGGTDGLWFSSSQLLKTLQPFVSVKLSSVSLIGCSRLEEKPSLLVILCPVQFFFDINDIKSYGYIPAILCSPSVMTLCLHHVMSHGRNFKIIHQVFHRTTVWDNTLEWWIFCTEKVKIIQS